MTKQITIHLAQLDTMIASMNKIGDQADQLDAYVAGSVCSTAGFDYPRCALKPIGDRLHVVARLFDQATDSFQDRWAGLADAAVASARHHVAQDEAVGDTLRSYRGEGAGSGKCYAAVDDADVEGFHIRDLTLRGAEAGGEELDHDEGFEVAAEAWDKARDLINEVLDKAAAVGVHLGTLPDKSLRDYVVFPLSGDYGQIRANADACGALDDAMGGWGDNFTQLAAKSYTAIEGSAGDGLRAHFVLYGRTMSKVGDCIGRARVVFDAIAAASERIAVKVERVLALLGRRLLSLASRIAGRVNPVISAVKFVGTAISKSPKEAVEELADIVRDVTLVYDTIQKCFDLADTVRAWAEAQAGRLRAFDDVLDTVSGLPGVGSAPGLGSIERHVGSVSRTLDDVDYTGDTRRETADLGKRLAGLGSGVPGADDAAPCVPTDAPPPTPAGRTVTLTDGRVA